MWRIIMNSLLKRYAFLTAILFFICTFIIERSSADEIILKNGDRLTGKVTKMENGTLILETEYSKPIEIKKDKVGTIRVDAPVDLHLPDGEILKGSIQKTEEDRLIVQPGEGRGVVLVEWNKLSAINPTPVPPSRWKGNVNLGAGLQSGNTDRKNASLGAEAERRTDLDRFTLGFLYNYAEEEDEVSARNTYGAAKYDYFFTRKFYGYLSVEMLHDKFKNLNLRTVVGPGVGYQVWDDKVKSLSFEAGLSYFSEDRMEGDDKDWLTARLSSSFQYYFTEHMYFRDHVIIYPSLEQGGEFQLRNEASLIAKLNSYWSLNLKNIYEHDSDPAKDVQGDDWQWILGIQYDFGL
jgi:putative salt-induced outer membrane protein YdiY